MKKRDDIEEILRRTVQPVITASVCPPAAEGCIQTDVKPHQEALHGASSSGGGPSGDWRFVV